MPSLRFTVDSALLRELGEKLVETVHLALVELVKNSYDADATKVDVIFENDTLGRNSIKIIDNGTGMNFASVEKYWMRIATSNKARKKHSLVFGRPLTGAKGIGRFSCRRLGTRLKLITLGTADGNKIGLQKKLQKTEVDFPWTEFVPGKSVTDIECPGTQTTVKNQRTGTTLIISNISESEWGLKGYNWLKRQLAVLAANRGKKRKGYAEDTGFNVSLTTPQFKETVKDLRENLINAGWGTLTATVNSQHQAVCELDALGLGKRKIVSQTQFKHLKDIYLKIGIMVDDRSQIRETNLISKTTVRQIIDDWGGVQVRYKGFRVYPYGDNDWLKIDLDRGFRRGTPKNELYGFAQTLKGIDPGRALLNMLSGKSYIGNVEINETSPGFEMKANREGFLDSPAVDELIDFVRYGIHWATILRDYYLRERNRQESREAKDVFEDLIGEKVESAKVVDAAVDYLESEVKTIARSLDPTERRKVEKSFLKATDAIRKHTHSNQSELSHLRIIASTSTLLLIFSHEVRSLLGLLEDSKASLKSIAKNLEATSRNEVLAISEDFGELKERLDGLLELTSQVGVDHRKAKPSQVAFKEKLKRVIKVFELICSKYEIEIDYSSVPNNTTLNKILEAEVYSILLNILSNAIKAVIAGGNNRKISVSAKREKGNTILSFKDSGVGLDPTYFDEVFVPFISDPDGTLYKKLEKRINPEDELIIGSGSGLGLGIVMEIVHAHNGSISFVKPDKGWKTELEISLP